MIDPIETFLESAGWGDAQLNALAGDASTRSYQRVRKGNRTAVLMLAPPKAEQASCPRDASQRERQQLGYNASARLAGPNLAAFVSIAKALSDAGFSAPQVYAADTNSGFALIEDLGDDLFARVVGRVDEKELYRNAVEVLCHLRASKIDVPETERYQLMKYDDLALETEARLFLEWYLPLKTGNETSAAFSEEFVAAIREMLNGLGSESTIVLRDFHAENLLWMPQRQGVKRVGLIDFQDALIGSPAYDLASLLEDARRDVSSETAAFALNHYCESADLQHGFDREQFLADYAILAAQRNAKILGIFARLAKRDGKPKYLDLLPRVEAHFRNDLSRPAARPLREFFARNFTDMF